MCDRLIVPVAKLHKSEVQLFRYAIPANSEAEANKTLQETFPWTFYKHVKVQWGLIAENA